MYYIFFVTLGIVSGIIQYFIERGWLKKTLVIISLLSFTGLGIIGYFDVKQNAKLQSQVKLLSGPVKYTLYDSSGNAVARILPGEFPSENWSQYSEVNFNILCDVTKIDPGDIVTMYPFGQPIKMKLSGSSTITGGGTVWDVSSPSSGSAVCQSPASGVFTFIK